MNCIVCVDRPALARGLCGSCYRTARLLVRGGEQSWSGLEALGMATPEQKRGRKPGTFKITLARREGAKPRNRPPQLTA